MPVRGAAETYRLVGPNGTVRLTNAPTGAGYEKLGQPRAAVTETRVLPVDEASRTARAPRYAHAIRQASLSHSVPEALIRAIIQAESEFNHRAVSPKGARGLMQLMPSTAAVLGVHDPHDPRQNIDGGVRHLRGLMRRFSNDLPLVLAAYHAGEAAVVSARGIPSYPSTREYVTRVLRLVEEFAHAGLPGGEVPDGPAADGTRAMDKSGTDEVTLLPGSICRVRQPDGAILYTNITPCPLPSTGGGTR